MVRRDVSQRYRGSFLGPFWAVITPAVQIAIFTLIFAGIFQARFGRESGTVGFAVHLFCGLLPWIAFSEAVQRSTTVIVDNVNLVKRVVFPVEILPVNVALTALAHQLLGTVVLLVAALLLGVDLTRHLLWWPVLLIPQLMITLGLSWFVSSLGVYLRDTGQSIQLFLMTWLYLTPIFYPESIIPARYAWLVAGNPMAPLIRSYRRILLEGRPPDWKGLVATLGVALFCLVVGYRWFERTRRGFADVI